LAKANVLVDHKVTTHWEDIADLRQQFPRLHVVENTRWVDEGRIVTSAGISAGIDMSLHLVERLAGRELAIATARQMEFEWQQT
jgi:transcriptional regulator GlxA family with amidase domain